MNSKQFFREWVQPEKEKTGEPEMTVWETVFSVSIAGALVGIAFTMISVAKFRGGHYTLASAWWGEIVTKFFGI